MYKNANGLVKDSFQSFLVEGANFTNEEEYPIIENWMIPKELPQRIISFNEAINYRGDLSNCYVCFYAQDDTFERIRKNPKKYINFFKRCAGIIGFDYSIHSDMPIIKQKSQMNDNLSLTYFYGSKGVKIIPNIRCGIDDLIQEFFCAIPKNAMISIGTYGFIKEISQRAEWYCFIEKIIEVLDPKVIIVYGSLSKDIIEDFSSKVEFVLYDSWFLRRKKEIISNGN